MNRKDKFEFTSHPSLLLVLTGVMLALTFASPAQTTHAAPSDQTMYGIAGRRNLVKFNSANTCEILSDQQITGLQDEEKILGIDFRPATGQLYGLGSSSRLYTIDLATAAATPIGTQPFTTTLQGKFFGFDFNPTVDRIRIVSNTGQNLRLHPDTGAIGGVDGTLAYAVGDPNETKSPRVVGVAYTNPDNDPTTGTTLYDIDRKLDLLSIQNPPNNGTLNTVAGLNRKVGNRLGFDIAADGTAYVAFNPSEKDEKKECGESELATLDLATGQMTSLGFVGTDDALRGLAVPTQ